MAAGALAAGLAACAWTYAGLLGSCFDMCDASTRAWNAAAGPALAQTLLVVAVGGAAGYVLHRWRFAPSVAWGLVGLLLALRWSLPPLAPALVLYALPAALFLVASWLAWPREALGLQRLRAA